MHALRVRGEIGLSGRLAATPIRAPLTLGTAHAMQPGDLPPQAAVKLLIDAERLALD